MNFNQLRTFYFTVKNGSVSAAAEALNVSQPAVTKQIQQLQSAYGIKFLNRFGKKMVLTDAGEALYDFADRIFTIENQIEEKIRAFQQRKSGRIRIHTAESFGAYYLPSIVNLFKKTYPQMDIAANIFLPQQVIENTLRLDNDLGFIPCPFHHKKLVVREVLEDRIVLIAPPSHPFTRKILLRPRDLEGQSMIMHERGSATRNIVDEFIQKHRLSVFVTLELSSNEGIKRAVEQGIGLSLISANVVSEEVRRKKLKAIPLSDQSLKRKFYMIHHKDKYISQPLKILIDMVYQWSSICARPHS